MKKYFLTFILVLTLAIASNVWATPNNVNPWSGTLPYTGSISGGSGIYGTFGWSGSGTTFSWDVLKVGANWEYNYTFTVPSKGISHIIIQVSNDFIADLSDPKNNLFAGTTNGWDFDIYSSTNQGHSNPGMPDEITGIKWDRPVGTSENTMSVKIVTDKVPAEGNFYSKDGKDKGEDVFAFSGTVNGFGFNVPVPDTTNTNGGKIPEPISLILLGSGLAGAGLYRRLRKPKN